MPRILQGSIVRAKVRDTGGENPKTRPLVVVTKNSEISEDGIFVGIAITGEFDSPPSDDEVLLQWHPQGRCRTRLIKPCVAKCTWVRQLRMSDIVEVRGHVPPAEFEVILAKIGDL